MKLNLQKGSGLLETILAVAILAIILIGFVQSIMGFSATEIKAKYRSESALAAQEGIEVAYNLARADWDNFATLSGGTYHPVFTDTDVLLNPGEKTLDINPELIRSIKIFKVFRDPVTSQFSDSETGQEDPNTLKVESSVFWGNGNKDKRVTYMIYISNLEQEEEGL